MPSAFLARKPHTRILEVLAVELAQLSFRECPALDALTLMPYKPEIREGCRRIGERCADEYWREARVLVEAETAEEDPTVGAVETVQRVMEERGLRRCQRRLRRRLALYSAPGPAQVEQSHDQQQDRGADQGGQKGADYAAGSMMCSKRNYDSLFGDAVPARQLLCHLKCRLCRSRCP
jgi:NAD-dependent dihydropyrimidine dehydrogenase PreA subunit